MRPRAWLCPVGSQGCSPIQSGSTYKSLVLQSLRILCLPDVEACPPSYGDSAGRGGCWDLEVLQRGQALCRDYSGRLCRVLCLLEHHCIGPDLLEACLGRAFPTRHSLEIRSSEMPWAGGMLWRKRIRILVVLLHPAVILNVRGKGTGSSLLSWLTPAGVWAHSKYRFHLLQIGTKNKAPT